MLARRMGGEPGVRSGAGIFAAIRPRTRLLALLAVVLVVVVGVVGWFTPALAVREVRITGTATIPEQQVRDLLEIPEGLSVLRVDTESVAERVATIPKVRSARVQRSFPSTVQVTVTERTPVLYYGNPDSAHLLDADGVEYAIEPAPKGVPSLRTENPGGADPLTRAAVEVMAAAPSELRAQVEEVAAGSLSEVSLRLRDGRTVVWGSSEDAARKSAVVMPLLTQPGRVFDVSSPGLVTVK